MSDPTQPEGMNPEHPSTRQSDRENANTPPKQGETLKAQAYVDPSIRAEAEVNSMEAQVAGLEAEIAEFKDKFIRAHAEMDNLRKRTEREKADTSKYAISRFAGDVLAVADNLQRALTAFSATGAEPDPHTKSLIEGIELTESELTKALDRHGVRKIVALGALFDPNFHQAVMEEENKDIATGTVLRVFQEGYQIGERVLRPSMVVVARGGFKPVKASPEATSGANEDATPAADNDGGSRQAEVNPSDSNPS